MNNSYRFILPENDQSIDIPVEIKWDFQGHTDSIELYEDEVLEEIIGLPKDFEICRFAHDFYGTDRMSQLEYQFYFFKSQNFYLFQYFLLLNHASKNRV